MPQALHFQMSGKLIFGNGCLAELPDVLAALGTRRPLLVTDPGLVEAGLADKVSDLLTGAGLEVSTFAGVEPDPRIEIVDTCAAAAKSGQCDVVIGFGGGSSMDIAKLTAVVASVGGDVRDYIGVDNVPEGGLATVMIPTTSGTGSEVTPIAVLSDKQAHLKKGVVSEHLYADVALVDPELTVGLPAHVTAFTAMDALAHAIESYTNRNAQPFVNTLALEAIRLIGAYLRRAFADGADLEARYHLSLASVQGGLCLGSVNTTAVHALAYPLGGMFDVPHGVANSLLLPYVMEFNRDSAPAKFARIAAALGEEVADLNETEAGARAVSAVRAMAKDVEITSKMRELNVPCDAIDEMATAAMTVTRLLNNNPKEVALDDARAIYRSAW